MPVSTARRSRDRFQASLRASVSAMTLLVASTGLANARQPGVGAKRIRGRGGDGCRRGGGAAGSAGGAAPSNMSAPGSARQRRRG
jgi:hypothetical protein